MDEAKSPEKEKKKRVTHLLHCWRNGDDRAMDELMPIIYQELQSRARFYLRKERKNHTLSSAALVNEVYLQIIEERDRDWHNRAHFFAISARIMKNFLIQYAHSRNALKRGGDQIIFSLDNLDTLNGTDTDHLLPLNHGLEELEKKDKQKAWIMEMHYFAGMTIKEIGVVLDISPATVKREMQFSRAWPRKFLKKKVV